MKKKFTTTALAFLLGSALVTGSWAAEEYETVPERSPAEGEFSTPGQLGDAPGQQSQLGGESEVTQEQTAQAATAVQDAEQIIGKSVQNPEGQRLGKIKSLLVDMDSGQVGYAVLAAGGFAGMGGTEYLVPWNALETTPEQEILLSMSQDQLQEAPQGETIASREEARQIFEFYGVSPYWEQGADQQRQMRDPMMQDPMMQDPTMQDPTMQRQGEPPVMEESSPFERPQNMEESPDRSIDE